MYNLEIKIVDNPYKVPNPKEYANLDKTLIKTMALPWIKYLGYGTCVDYILEIYFDKDDPLNFSLELILYSGKTVFNSLNNLLWYFEFDFSKNPYKQLDKYIKIYFKQLKQKKDEVSFT